MPHVHMYAHTSSSSVWSPSRPLHSRRFHQNTVAVVQKTHCFLWLLLLPLDQQCTAVDNWPAEGTIIDFPTSFLSCCTFFLTSSNLQRVNRPLSMSPGWAPILATLTVQQTYMQAWTCWPFLKRHLLQWEHLSMWRMRPLTFHHLMKTNRQGSSFQA